MKLRTMRVYWQLTFAAFIWLSAGFPVFGGPKVVVMPVVLSNDYGRGVFSRETSRISERIEAELFRRYDCEILSRHNPLALQAERLRAVAAQQHANLDSLLPPAANFLVQLRDNPSDRRLAVDLVFLGEAGRTVAFELEVEDPTLLRFELLVELTDRIAADLGLERRTDQNGERRDRPDGDAKEVIALLTPKLSVAIPPGRAGEVEAAALVGLSMGAGDADMVDRSQIRRILEEQYLGSLLGSMPGTERAIGMLLGATRLIEITINPGRMEIPGEALRLDAFSVDPLSGQVEAVETRLLEPRMLVDPAYWMDLLSDLRKRADQHVPGNQVSEADGAQREAELRYLLTQLASNGFVMAGQGNFAVLSQCEAASTLSGGREEALLAISGALRRTHYPGRFRWPGSRQSESVKLEIVQSSAELAGELEELDARNRDVFLPLADALERTGNPGSLYKAALLRNFLGAYDEALQAANRIPETGLAGTRYPLLRTRMRAWAHMGLGRCREARDEILNQGTFDLIDMLMAADACRLLGDEAGELQLLWRNRNSLRYGQEVYERHLFSKKAASGEVDLALDYFRNQMEGRNKNEILSRKAYIEVLRDAGRTREAAESAWVSKQDPDFMRDDECRTLVEELLPGLSKEDTILKQPHEVLRPAMSVRFELHPVEGDPDSDRIVDLANRINRMWGVEVAIFPRVNLPRKMPIYDAGPLSFDHRAAVDYIRLLRPELTDGCVARLHVFLRDVHSTSSDSGGGSSNWGASLALRPAAAESELLKESDAALLSSMALRVPIFHTYREEIHRATGWHGMPSEYPSLFSVNSSMWGVYLPTLTPASARVLKGFDLKQIAITFAKLWDDPERLEQTRSIRLAFPDLPVEKPDPVSIISHLQP